MSAIIQAHTYRLQYREGEGVLLEDRSSGQKWLWPEATLGAVKVLPLTVPAASFFVDNHCGKDRVELAADEEWAVQAVHANQHALQIELAGPSGRIVQCWELDGLGLCVRTEVKAWDYANTEVRLVSPGIVRSLSGESPAVVPVYQGILHRKGEYAALIAPGSHGRYQLGAAGLLGSRGALSAIVELNWDYDLHVRARDNLEDEIAYVPKTTFGQYAVSYTTCFRPCRSHVFDVAQTYREYKIAKGQFVAWDQKLQTTPGLEAMFGAVQFFIGYFDSGHDYLAALKQAKAMGFDNAFVYPTVFRSFNPDMPLKEGARWIDISRLHEDIKTLGYHVASWSWPGEAAVQPNSDRGLWAIMGLNEQGEYAGGWSTGDYEWYSVAGEAQVQYMHWAQKHMWPELTAQHFDVTGNLVFPHLYGRKKFDRAADAACRRTIFEQASVAGPVSTEGFCDGFQEAIHCGSVMAYPSWGERDWWTVPLNSLVFHDSAMNVWWECDSYNNPHHRRQHHRDQYVTPAGGGKALEQSLWDALQGTPPHIFLCGKMYRPADDVFFSNGYTFYEMDFHDEQTQYALQLAKPIADLHRKVGRQRIVAYDMLTANGQVQRTTFQDGAVVTVNFGDTSWTDGQQTCEPKSWTLS